MRKTKKSTGSRPERALQKCPTGIEGLDQITGGGLPRGRPTLVCGGAGCGKTLVALEFLVRGALEFGEPGVFLSFEESAEELSKNVASLGFDLEALQKKGLLAIDHVHLDRREIEETGEYDLEGLFVRLALAIDSTGAKRVALDAMETLFVGFDNASILRAEMRRLFQWLKDRRVTSIVTAERGEGTLTRHGFEEYISDCVILLDHRVNEQISTRRLRVVKYRGSTHGTNEYPFLIEPRGLSVLPVTSLGLEYPISTERVSTGIARLDEMLEGKGYYRGSSILVSGSAGTGKSSTAAHFVDAACRRGQRCVYFAFEESPGQIMRNMRSIGIDLGRWQKKGLLRFHAARPTLYGLEMHLVAIHRLIEEIQPDAVVVDPVSNFIAAGSAVDVKSMLMRLIDHLKTKGVTTLLTCLTIGIEDETDVGISSLIDTWIRIQDVEVGNERVHGLYILKSRGMAHSRKVHRVTITSRGVELAPIADAGPPRRLQPPPSRARA